MEILNKIQKSPEFGSVHQKRERNNSTSFIIMELINNTKMNLDNKINNVFTILQKMKKENEQNISKSKYFLFLMDLFLSIYSYIILRK